MLPLAILGCGGGGGDSGGTGPDRISITVEGRLERGGTISLQAQLDGSRIMLPDLMWTAEPANAVEFLANGGAKLLTAGSVKLTARSSGQKGSRALPIVVPPSVLFDQIMGGNRDIYSVAIDGGDLVRLTTHTADDRDAAYNGSEIWFTSYRDGNGELYSMPSTGGAGTRMTTTTNAEEREVAFKPVQTVPPPENPRPHETAYTSNVTGVAKLWKSTYLMPPGGGPAAPSFGYSGSIDAAPSWAPGGSVVFMSTADGPADLYLLAVGSVTRLTAGPTPNFEPAFNFDGTRIVFGSSRGGLAKIYIYDVSSKAVTPLTSGAGDDGQSAWLEDGRVVFTSWRSGTAKLYWVDPAAPAAVHEIPTGATEPQRPSAR